MREILCSGQARSLEFPYPGGMAALCWSPAGERGELTVSLHYDGAYGMGEKYNAVNQKGHTAVNEVCLLYTSRLSSNICAIVGSIWSMEALRVSTEISCV